jgi:hypothetical protein
MSEVISNFSKSFSIFLSTLFNPKDAFANGLEDYIASKKPQTVEEVERILKEYFITDTE